MEGKVIEVVKVIHEKMKKEKIDWVLGGSTSLFLQGIAVEEIADIDIMTDREGAYRMNEIFKDFEMSPVKYSETERVKSYRGQLKIKDMVVDITGDFCLRIGGRWVDSFRKRLEAGKFIEMGDMRIQVTPLECHLESYEVLGREKDSDKVRGIKVVLERRAL